jgi:hypothetical protein
LVLARCMAQPARNPKLGWFDSDGGQSGNQQQANNFTNAENGARSKHGMTL